MFTQQQIAILLEALDLWNKQYGARVAGATHEVLVKLQQISMAQQQVAARNGAMLSSTAPPPAPPQQETPSPS